MRRTNSNNNFLQFY